MGRLPLACLLVTVAGGCSGPAGSGAADAGVTLADPGRVTIHRLNRAEYNNTVRDLLGTKQRPADDFPADDRGYGFDNIADVLSLSPLQLELYFRAAEKLADEAIDLPPSGQTVRFGAADDGVTATAGAAYNGGWNLFSNGELSASARLPAAGKYTISVRAFGQQAGPDPASMSILVDEKVLQTFAVTAVEAGPMVYRVTATISGGAHQIAASFNNDFYNPMLGQDRNLVVEWIEVAGPLDAPTTNPARDRLVTCDPTDGKVAPIDCARETLGRLARRAFRRPPSDDEVRRLLALVLEAAVEHDDFYTGIKLGIEALLMSPNFLFRVELDADPAAAVAHPLDDYELASRLSYFLWSTMPDDALLAAADAGGLRDPQAIRAQVLRMLDDPRAIALTDNFAGQWLYTRALDDQAPDVPTFPTWDADLKAAMRGETEAYFQEFLHGDVGLDQLLTADFGFVNARLARHYGIPFAADGGTDFVKVKLPDERRGLLGQASILTVTSFPRRTSPVRRGKWVLEQLLCSAPKPPPANVPPLPQESIPTGSMRQKLEAHRADPNCAICHQSMDPIGFGLERFDAIGAHRTTDAGFPIDDTGTLPPEHKFSGAVELAHLITADVRFPRCTAQQLMTYALGRGIGNSDGAALDAIVASFAGGGYKLRELIVAIAQSEPFRMRRGEPQSGGGN